MGRKVSSGLSFQLNCGMTVNGKIDKRSKSGVSYQMTNPYFGLSGAYRSNKKQISLGSCSVNAKEKALAILDRTITEKFKNITTKVIENPNLVTDTLPNTIQFKEPLMQEVVVGEITTIVDIIDAVNQEHDEQIKDGALTPASKGQYQNYYNMIIDAWRESNLSWICTSNIKMHISKVKKSVGICTARTLESRYRQILKISKTAGLVGFSKNPHEDLTKVYYKPQRARLDLPEFECANAKYKDNEVHYNLMNQFLLATKLRAEDACLFRAVKGDDWEQRVKNHQTNRNYGLNKRMSFSDKKEHAPYGYVDKQSKFLVLYHQKSKKITRLSFKHKLSKTDKTLGELIIEIEAICKFQSDFLLHHTYNVGLAKVGMPLRPDSISRKFSKNINALVDNNEKKILWNGTHPTLHEIKSLSIRTEEKYIEDKKTKKSDKNKKPETSSKNVEDYSKISEFAEKALFGDDCLSIAAGHNSEKTRLIYQNCRYENAMVTDGFTFAF